MLEMGPIAIEPAERHYEVSRLTDVHDDTVNHWTSHIHNARIEQMRGTLLSK